MWSGLGKDSKITEIWKLEIVSFYTGLEEITEIREVDDITGMRVYNKKYGVERECVTIIKFKRR